MTFRAISLRRWALAATGVLAILAGGVPSPAAGHDADDVATDTPIKHVVVIFQENVSFDHYFATYPTALNPSGEPGFTAKEGTPTVNGLGTLTNGQPDGVLLTDNPNANNPANAPFAINPFRLDRTQAPTCDQDHNYGDEQRAFNQGLMNAFPATVGNGGGPFCDPTFSYGKGKGLVMGYFDGNTTTALWNYAQRFAMNDNSYGSTFGPSTPGLLNLVAGNTFPAMPSVPTTKVVPNNAGPGALVGDLDPTGDACSAGTTVRLGGQNVGDVLNAKHVSWGAFMGGFDLTAINPNHTTGCNRSSPASASNAPAGTPPALNTTKDYIPHHAFFQYFQSTANPAHTRPSSLGAIGTANDGGANHQYDLHDFFDALAVGNMPAVSFLKAAAAHDGHAGYSDPLLEQSFLVDTINTIMRSPFWESTAIIVLYDDSDGWYDHQMSPIVNPSAVLQAASSGNSDQLNAPGVCGQGAPLGGIEGRCGYGPRQPLLVISPFAKTNFVDHTLTDQSSVLRFVEDNWGTGKIGGGSFDQLAGPLDNMFDFDSHDAGERRLILDPTSGEALEH